MKYRPGPYGIIERLRKEDLNELESSADIWKRLPRGANGEVLLSPELIQVMEALIIEGNTRNNAARVVGLSRKTLSKWLKTGADDVANERNTIEAVFTWMVDRCEGDQERQLSRAATRAGLSPTSDGTLALKILERRNADDWAPALPEMGDITAQYGGLQRAALAVEAERILKLAAKGQEMVGEVVPPQKS